MRVFRTLVLVFASLAIHAQLTPDTISQIDQAAKEALRDSQTPALTLAIVVDGKIALTKAYGDARPSTPADPAMRFPIGSVSKQFLAVAMLIAQDSGKLSLNEPVSKYFPDLTRAEEITVRQLLNHTAGYTDYYPQDYVPVYMQKPTTPQQIIDQFARKPLDFEPGTAWQYSNTGYVIAGRILEIATGMPLMQYQTEKIFKPLGMRSAYDLNAGPLPTTDPAGTIRYALGPLREPVLEGSGWLFAAGHLAMTAADLARWNLALIENRTPNGPLLSPASWREFITPVTLRNGTPTNYALGVGIRGENGKPRLSHGGAVAGFVSQSIVWPAEKSAVVVIANKENSSAPGVLAGKIAKLIQTPASDPDASRLTTQARAIFDKLQQGSIDRSLFTANANAYFSERALADFAQGLKPLGTPKSFQQVASGLRGGFTERVYSMVFEGKTLTVVVRADTSGKLEQFTVGE